MAKSSRRFSNLPSNREYFDPKQAKKQLLERAPDCQRYAKNILDLLPVKSGKLLDVGCGLGWLVKEAQNRGFIASGIDPATPYVQLGKKHLGVDIKVAGLEDLQTTEKYDVVILNHVLEHIKNLSAFLKKINSLLGRDGIILVACPNIRSLMYYIFRNRWYGLVPTQHHWQFSDQSLPKKISDNGFIIKKVIVNNLDYQVPGVKGLIFKLIIFCANRLQLGDQVIVIAGKN